MLWGVFLFWSEESGVVYDRRAFLLVREGVHETKVAWSVGRYQRSKAPV